MQKDKAKKNLIRAMAKQGVSYEEVRSLGEKFEHYEKAVELLERYGE